MTEKAIDSKKQSFQHWFYKLNQIADHKVWKLFHTADFWKGLALFGVFILCLALIQFSTPNLVGNDGYYHIKMAYMLRTEGLKPDFDWLPQTVLNQREYYDHHYLYHILMIPLTFGDLRLGAKIASIVFSAFAFISIWWLLKQQKVHYAGLWSLGLLFISEAFLYRMNMPRAQSLSLLLLIWTLHWLLQKRYQLLIPLGFIYVWSYNAFPLIIMVVGVYVAASFLIQREFHWQPLVYAVIGVVSGLVINPYFPENLAFIYRHLAPKLSDATSVSVGNEWFPYKTTTLIENTGGALLVFFAGILGLGMSNRRMNTATATNLLLVMFFGFLLFQSRRFVEYAPPFALIFAALSWSPLITEWKAKKVDSEGFPSLRTTIPPQFFSIFIPIFVAIILIPLIWLSLGSTRKDLQENTKPYQRYREASAWLIANTPKNSRIFQTDWDDFPRLFFYNDHNTYTIGLDPTYMQLFDDKLYDQWVAVTNGDVDKPSQVIIDQFESEYILTDLSHKNFLATASKDENIIQLYEDKYAVIFQVLR